MMVAGAQKNPVLWGHRMIAEKLESAEGVLAADGIRRRVCAHDLGGRFGCEIWLSGLSWLGYLGW